MPYPLSNRFKPLDRLLPEEEQLSQALSEYAAEGATAFDFTPSHLLYKRYLTYVHGFNRSEDAPQVLTTRQFGVALVRVFGLEGRRVQRRISGKPTWGYCGLKGPDSVVVRKHVGNPKWSKNDNE